MKIAIVDFTSYMESIPLALDSLNAREIFARQSSILIKPNLVIPSPHPITTSLLCCEALVEYIRSCTKAKIVIAEGTGDFSHETDEIFSILGYDMLAKRHNIKLMDLNSAPLKKLENKECPFFPEMYLPEIALVT